MSAKMSAKVSAKIIDGKAIAADLRGKVADAVHRLSRDRGITPAGTTRATTRSTTG